MCQVCDVLQVLVLETQSLGRSQVARVVVHLLVGVVLLELFGRHVLGRDRVVVGIGIGHLAVVGEKLLEVLGSKDRDLCEEKLALNERSAGVVQNSPDGHEVLELAAGLLNDTILTLQHNGHAREVGDFGAADDERVDVEAAGGQDTGHAREHTGLVLDKTVQDVAVARRLAGQRSLVENAGHSCGGRDAGGLGSRQWLDTAVQRLVCNGGGRGGLPRLAGCGREWLARGIAAEYRISLQAAEGAQRAF